MIKKALKIGAGALMISALMMPAANAADAAKGAKVFNKCKTCHTLEEGGANKIGPNLHGMFGRAAGTVEGFKYSKAMVDYGEAWEVENLSAYLKAPKDLVPGTKMAFAGIKKDSQLEDLILFLQNETGAAE